MSSDRNFFFARLFPVFVSGTTLECSAREITQIEMALWLAGSQLFDSVDTRDISLFWRSSRRLSLHDILIHTDFDRRIEKFT